MANLIKTYRNKKALITGGLGFLGSNLALSLCRLGAEVTVIDSFLPNHGANPFNIAEFKSEIKLIRGDIRNRSLLNKHIAANDFLFNIAAQTSHTDSIEHPLLDAQINNLGQLQILEACRHKNPDIRLIYCSTRAIYGKSDKKNIDEETIPNPLDIYSVNKLAGEYYHKIYAQVRNLNATILRVANGYGPRAQMRGPSFGILNWFIRLALDNEEIKIFGDGKQLRDYVYVDDIVQAFLAVGAQNDLKAEVLNIGSGKGLPLIKIVQEIIRISGSGKIKYVPWPENNKKIDVGDFIADIRQIRAKTNWNATTPLNQGLRDTIHFYRTNKKRYWS